MLISPVEAVGEYGGTWRMGLLHPGDTKKVFSFVEYENLVRWDANWDTIVPNIAQFYSFDDSMKVFTFILREGMKWSDGQNFTSNDIEFWYDSILCNPDITKRIPGWLLNRDGPVVFEKKSPTIIRFIPA